MKRNLMVAGIFSLLVLSTSIISGAAIVKQTKSNPVEDRGGFQAELGLRGADNPLITMDGNYKDFRRGHIIFGSINHVDSDQSTRFQGFTTRTRFIIQTAIRGSIINIIGNFDSYDEATQAFSGIWAGMIAGQGRTRGWITAQFT